MSMVISRHIVTDSVGGLRKLTRSELNRADLCTVSFTAGGFNLSSVETIWEIN